MDALWHWVNRTLMYEKQNVAKACKTHQDDGFHHQLRPFLFCRCSQFSEAETIKRNSFLPGKSPVFCRKVLFVTWQASKP